jgi:hypothetical protein
VQVSSKISAAKLNTMAMHKSNSSTSYWITGRTIVDTFGIKLSSVSNYTRSVRGEISLGMGQTFRQLGSNQERRRALDAGPETPRTKRCHFNHWYLGPLDPMGLRFARMQ